VPVPRMRPMRQRSSFQAQDIRQPGGKGTLVRPAGCFADSLRSTCGVVEDGADFDLDVAPAVEGLLEQRHDVVALDA
jgi:hypothetical protein